MKVFPMTRRKVCIVLTNRASYARVKTVLQGVEDHAGLELQLVVGASLLLHRFGKVIDIIKSDGFQPAKTMEYLLEGDTLSTQAKSTGLGINELASIFNDLNPDVVVTVADRFETISTAITASYMNIPLAHIQGGELSGNIDDKVRHAVTKLADFHFPATDEAKKRVIRMGEFENTVFNYGCPSIDLLNDETMLPISSEEMVRYSGVGAHIDWQKDYFLMLQHPVTTSFGDGRGQITHSLEALKSFNDIQKIVLWPNVDAGTDDVSKGIRNFREQNHQENFHYYKNFSPEVYAKVLANCLCAVGNSSSFLREGAYLGAPCVLVGDRQEGREHGSNVVFADYSCDDIISKIQFQIESGKYKRQSLFGEGDAGVKIAEKLAQIPLRFTKRMSY